MLNGNYADSNFLGTGRRIAFDLNIGEYSQVGQSSRTPTRTSGINNMSR